MFRRWGRIGSYGEPRTRIRAREFKTVIKESFDTTRTISVKVKNALIGFRCHQTGQQINELVQKCIKHGSVDVFRY